LETNITLEDNTMRNFYAAVTCIALVLPTQLLAQTPETNFYYKLSTEFRGTSMPMDVFNGGPQDNQVRLNSDQDVSGQFWNFVPANNVSGFYKLKTQFRGSGMCLDINPPTNRPELRGCGEFTGQLWQLKQDGPWIKLSTQFRGPDVCLDIDPASNQPELRGCGAFTGQHWQLVRTNNGVQ
jgi:hypothetical protein